MLWVNSWKINKNQKRHFHIDSGTSKDQIFALLDTAQSDNKDKIEKLMNDSDTEFTTPEVILITDNPDYANVLTPESNICAFDEGTTHTKEL